MQSEQDGKFTLYIFQPQLEIENNNERNILYKVFIFRGLRGTSVAYMLTEKWKWLHVSRDSVKTKKQNDFQT